MFLNGKGGYNRDGEQFFQGQFLIVGQEIKGGRELRALVRQIRMKQLGHWMMANVNLKGIRHTLSGTYGSDGLPDNIPQEVWPFFHPIPAELQEAFWKGGGHNTSGPEGPLFRQWGLENLKTLAQYRKPQKGQP